MAYQRPININVIWYLLTLKRRFCETIQALCFDLLFPKVGEVCGGSLREYDRELLMGRIKECGANLDSLTWLVEHLRVSMRITDLCMSLNIIFEKIVAVVASNICSSRKITYPQFSVKI